MINISKVLLTHVFLYFMDTVHKTVTTAGHRLFFYLGEKLAREQN